MDFGGGGEVIRNVGTPEERSEGSFGFTSAPPRGPFKARKKPVVIEALQLRWDTWSEMCEFVSPEYFDQGCYVDANGRETENMTDRIGLKIKVLEGVHLAVENDYVIRAAADEFYSCKPEIFEQTYEVVKDDRG